MLKHMTMIRSQVNRLANIIATHIPELRATHVSRDYMRLLPLYWKGNGKPSKFGKDSGVDECLRDSDVDECLRDSGVDECLHDSGVESLHDSGVDECLHDSPYSYAYENETNETHKLSAGQHGTELQSDVCDKITTHEHGEKVTCITDKVLIIITGGTVCMVYEGQEAALTPQSLAKELFDVKELHSQMMPSFDVLEWDEVRDSSDVGFPEHKLIAEQLYHFYDDYKGFVIVHGTDTMACTSSVLCFMLENLSKPVVITGSMLPLRHPLTDAKRNLGVSLVVAGNGLLAEVVVAFGSQIIRGSRAKKVNSTSLDAFESINFPPLGTVGMDVVLSNNVMRPKPPPSRKFTIFTDMATSIAIVVLNPYLSADYIRSITEHRNYPRAMVLLLYGSGTNPTNKNFIDSLADAVKKNIIIVAITQCLQGQANLSTYETSNALTKLGIYSAGDITLEACIAKLAYLIGKNYTAHDLKQQMLTNLRGEISVVRSDLVCKDLKLKTKLHAAYRVEERLPSADAAMHR